eukprot:7031830-Prorocentrum_lima.AAC.1
MTPPQSGLYHPQAPSSPWTPQSLLRHIACLPLLQEHKSHIISACVDSSLLTAPPQQAPMVTPIITPTIPASSPVESMLQHAQEMLE